MASYNKVIMMGNLTRDPELSYLPSQTAVVEFALATSHKYRGADGQDREDTCFIDCRMYGKRAEIIQKYFSKGKPIMIEGRLTFDRWDGPDGKKNSKHRIFVDNFTFVGGSEGGRSSGSYNSGSRQSSMDQMGAAEAESSYNVPQPPADDDIPF